MNTTLVIVTVVLGLSLIANILLGLVVLLRDPGKQLNRSFFALTLAGGLWVLTNLVYAVADQQSVQYLAALLSYSAAGLLVLFFLEYCLWMTRTTLNHYLAFSIYLVGLVVSVASAIPGVIATGVTESNKIITNGFPLLLYGLYLLVYLVWGLVLLLWVRHKKRGLERRKITIVIAGLALGAVTGLVFNLILPITGNYNFVHIGPASSLIFVGTSTYAIVRHRLFDIKFAAVRTIAYVGVLATLSGVYYLFAYLLSFIAFSGQVSDTISVNPSNIILALLLAFLFQPFKRFFDSRTNAIFYRDTYKSEDFFAELSQLLASTTDMRGLLGRASEKIADTLKAEQALFFLYYRNTETHHMSAGTHGHTRLLVDDARMLDMFVAEHAATQVILTDALAEGSGVQRMLASHKIGLVMPLRRGEETIGYLLLGEKLSGGYVTRDIKSLTTVADGLVIAIQNALSLHEIKEINATLQERIDSATKELRSSNSQLRHLDEVKDEFISMASHQLRTPLTSIKGYISMVLEGDMGKVGPQQERVLKEAFNSSERMVRLISDFLNVSRLQTGKFVIERQPVDLGNLVRHEVEGMRPIASAHEQKIEYLGPVSRRKISVDENKIQQVVMNFIDNAVYYSPPHTTIHVELIYTQNEAVFTVKDQGMGVPAREQEHLFGKFFRADNARKQRPDGTGVGLFLAKKVITAHDGEIVFQSKEGKGSTFGFRLPLK